MQDQERQASAGEPAASMMSDPAAASHGTAPAADAAAQASGTAPDALEAALAKAKEHYDLYVRAKAETENIRRRAVDDVVKERKYAVESFAELLVPVMDSLEQALRATAPDAPTAATVETLREGVEITLRQLHTAFDKARLTPIDPLGQKFDPHRHQAISTVPATAEVAANHVVAVLQKGWMIADRVLRPALVTVAQA